MRSLSKALWLPAMLVGCGGANHAANGHAQPAQTTAPVTAEEPKPGPVAPHFAAGNGEVIEAPIPGVAAMAFRILFYSGSADDPPGKEGLTALTAKLMAEGGTKRMSYPEILKALYPLASEIDAHVAQEQTVFTGLVHPEKASTFIPILASVVSEPRFPEADFNRIRQDMVNDIEKRLRATDDENLGKEMLNLMLYSGGHPYGHYVGGTVEGLRSITLDDVRAHAAKVFGRKRMVIGLGGAIDPNAKTMLVDALKALPEGEPRIGAIARVPKPGKTEVLIANKGSKAVAISIGFTHDERRGTPDFSALALVQSYFGEHRQFHGVLMSEMREKRGLNYGDYAYAEKFIQDSYTRNGRPNIARRQQHFEIWIRPVDPKDSVFAVRLAMFLLNRLVADGLKPADLDGTRRFLAGYTRLWDLTPTRKLGYALDDHFYGTPGYLEGYRRDMEKLTLPDVNQAIKRNLVAGPLRIAIVSPDAEKLKDLLVRGEKSPKTYGAKVDPSVLQMDEQVVTFPMNITADDVKVVKVDDLFVK